MMNQLSFLSSPLPLFITFILTTIVHFPYTKAIDYYTNCTGSANYSHSSPYRTNLRILLATLPSQASSSGFYNSSLGQPPNQAYALYLCRADVDSNQCSVCVYQAQINILQLCPSQVWADIWFENCMVRFNNSSLYRTLQVYPSVVTWNPQAVPRNETRLFREALNETMAALVNMVRSSSGRFVTKEANVNGSVAQRLYIMGQCTPDLSGTECQKCFRVAVAQVPFRMLGGRVMQPSCIVRFELNQFYSDASNFTFLLAAINNSSNATEIPNHRA